MGTIYQNAYLTIAATHVLDGCQGLHALPQGRMRARPLLGLPMFVGEAPPGLPTNSSQLIIDEDEDGDADNDFPLLRRGWVLQERRLSSRTVHFLKHKIVWECRSGVKEEDRVAFNTRSQLSMSPRPFQRIEA